MNLEHLEFRCLGPAFQRDAAADDHIRLVGERCECIGGIRCRIPNQNGPIIAQVLTEKFGVLNGDTALDKGGGHGENSRLDRSFYDTVIL